MGKLTTETELNLIKHITKQGAYLPSAEVYIALSTTEPLPDGTGVTEPAGNGYIRKQILFSSPVNRVITQSTEIIFDVPLADWGNISHYALFTDDTLGTMIAFGAFTEAKEVREGKPPIISVGDVVVTIGPSGMVDAYAAEILNFLFNGAILTEPANIFVALLTTAISDAFTSLDLIDLVMTGYTRQVMNSWEIEASVNVNASNSLAIEFSTLTGTSETVVATALVDVASGNGNILFYSNDPSVLISSGDTVSFAANSWDAIIA